MGIVQFFHSSFYKTYKFFLLTLFFVSFFDTALWAIEAYSDHRIWIGFNGKRPSDNGVVEIAAAIESGYVGGVILLRKNIESPAQLAALTRYLHSLPSPFPISISIDQEGGRVQRLREREGFIETKSHAVLGSKKRSVVQKEYNEMAEQLSRFGIDINFGTVVDIHSDESSVIGAQERSYSADYRVVTKMSRVMLNAHREYGLVSAIKHFPGHGLVQGDSHAQMVISDRSVTLYKQWHPYYTLINEGMVDMVMVGHITVPALDPIYPASLSSFWVTEMLRERFRFKGLIVTDDLLMAALEDYSIEERIRLAVKAGNNILLFSSVPKGHTYKSLFEMLNSAVKSPL